MIYTKGDKIKSVASIALFVAVAVFVLNAAATTVCDKPLRYSVGILDPQFELEADQFKNMILRAEHAWEDEVGRELFVYEDGAEFKVNLIYDERQQRTDEARLLREQIDQSAKTYEELVEEYETLYPVYEERLNEYEDEVRYWNNRGGAPEGEYEELEQERQYLLAQVQRLNNLQNRINGLADKYNLNVENYNDKFIVAKPFDQGLYDGEKINIYQFDSLDDLELVLVHELGHALNLDHVENDPRSVMYHLLDEQETNPIRITQSDLNMLKMECNLE